MMNGKQNGLTDVDKEIVKKLQADGRRAYADIAAELGVAPSTVQQRANRLMDRGLLKVRAVTDPIEMGVPVVGSIALKVDGRLIREVADKVASFPENTIFPLLYMTKESIKPVQIPQLPLLSRSLSPKEMTCEQALHGPQNLALSINQSYS